MLFLRVLSPYMTFADLKWMLNFEKLIELNSGIYETLLSDGESSMYSYSLKYAVPVIIAAGDRDWTTPYCMALRYFKDISAPYKEFVTIGGTGHIPFADKPGEFAEALLNALDHAFRNASHQIV